MVRITSRMTQLTAFLREVLQAASTKEIYQLFFTNVTKAFGAKEVALLTILTEDNVAVINKAAHPEYGRLEGKRIDLSEPAAEILARVAEKGVPMLLPARVVYFEPELGACLILPVQVDGRCEALVTLGLTRQEEDLTTEDATFLGGLAELAGYGVEQLQVVLNS
jgi:GAF domain-containing protein